MARTAKPLPMTLAEWKAKGCPPLKLSVVHVAEWAGITRARVNDYIKRGLLHRIDAECVLPTEHPLNKPWLLDREGFERNELQAPGRAPGTRVGVAPVRDVASAAPAGENGRDTLDLEVVLDAISRMDLTALPSAAVQKVQRLESAYKTRIEHQAKRGLLIERRLVQTVFGRLFMIDSDQLKPLGAKLAPDIAGEFGIEDPASLLRIEQRVDTEIARILSHIKRLMDDFLVGVGAEPVDES